MLAMARYGAGVADAGGGIRLVRFGGRVAGKAGKETLTEGA